MLLVMHNLPSTIKYSDVKALIQNKCFIDEIILDKLVKESATSKKVTIGVAKEEDATRILHRLNGTYVGGQQIYIEDVKKNRPHNTSEPMDSYSMYEPPQNNQTQMSNYSRLNNQNSRNMSGYNNNTPNQYQGGMNTMTQGNGGYRAWMTSGNSSMTQSDAMGYGNQQQGQYSASQGWFDGRAGSQMSPQRDTRYGVTSGNRHDERGYSNNRQNETTFPSGNSRNEPGTFGRSHANGYGSGDRNERGFSSQQSYPNTEYNRGFGPQSTLVGSRREDRDEARPSFGREEGSRRRSPPPLMGINFGSRDFGINRFGSGGQRESRGIAGPSYTGNLRETRDFSQDSWENKERFDRSRELGDRPRSRDDDRKRRRSPERGNTYRGSSRDGFHSNPEFDGNLSRGFDRNRDTRDFNRAGPPRDSYLPNPTPKPFLELPNPFKTSSFSNLNALRLNRPSPPRPFGGDKPGFNDNKDRIQWNRNPGPPMSHSSPVRNPIPPKRAKVEGPVKKSPVAALNAKFVSFQQKTANRAFSWRGEGVSSLAREMMQNYKEDGKFPKKNKVARLKLLKNKINDQLEVIIKRRYPRSKYPVLHVDEVVKLYREVHPQREDYALITAVLKDPSVRASELRQPDPVGVKAMPPPANVKVPHIKTNGSPGKPKVPSKFGKPTLADLLPPQVLQSQPERPPRPTRPLAGQTGPERPKLMLGPNALKKKTKPYNIEKRMRAEQRQLAKKEFLLEDLYKCQTPAQEKALQQLVDEITDVFNAAIDEYPTTTTEEKLIGESIKERAAPEFRAMIRLHTVKRLLNVTSSLLLRIFVNGGKAPRENVEATLKPYGLLYMKSSMMAKTQMFTAGVRSYQNYDKLCKSPGIPIPGKYGTSTIVVKPLYLTMPMNIRRVKRQMGSLTGDDDSDYFEGDEDGDGLPDDEDDDVIEIKTENDVIELSGDETTLNTPDDKEVKDEKQEVNRDNKDEELNIDARKAENKVDARDNTVDLTVDDTDLTVDEKMSAAIEDEMGDSVVEIDEDEIAEDDLEDY